MQPKLIQASDQSLLLDFSGLDRQAAHAQVVRFFESLQQVRLPGVRNLHPAYQSILLVFDPALTEADSLREQIQNLKIEALPENSTRHIDVPVRYDGPDLSEVASIHRLTPDQVIHYHSSVTYQVYFLGFVPGFAYLGDVSPEIRTPRRKSPRTTVPAGSVAIAGNQTGVYPFNTPGGWQILGHTETKLFDSSHNQMSLLQLGDTVRFYSI